MIIIKPHHFIDIIKLYGAGVECFVPDEAFNHAFYKVANQIINDFNTELMLTIEGDDICKPCNRYNGKKCTDPLINVIKDFEKKDDYNKVLDTRIIQQLKLDNNKTYTVKELVSILDQDKKIIFNVWKEENDILTNRRNNLFRIGVDKIIKMKN